MKRLTLEQNRHLRDKLKQEKLRPDVSESTTKGESPLVERVCNCEDNGPEREYTQCFELKEAHAEKRKIRQQIQPTKKSQTIPKSTGPEATARGAKSTFTRCS